MKMVSIFGSVAQLVERTTENREVTGSTPVGATISKPLNIRGFLFASFPGGAQLVPSDNP